MDSWQWTGEETKECPGRGLAHPRQLRVPSPSSGLASLSGQHSPFLIRPKPSGLPMALCSVAASVIAL